MAKRYWLVATILFWWALPPSVAFGSLEFPEPLGAELGYDCYPTCLLCHNDLRGGHGTVTKPFGVAMVKHGLIPQRPDTVVLALRALEMSAEPTESEMVKKLRRGENPNPLDSNEGGESGAGGGSGIDVCLTGPQYGCSSRIEPRGMVDGWGASLAAFVLGVLLLLRRRDARGH